MEIKSICTLQQVHFKTNKTAEELVDLLPAILIAKRRCKLVALVTIPTESCAQVMSIFLPIRRLHLRLWGYEAPKPAEWYVLWYFSALRH